jgi:hypothetical protein
MYKKYLLLCLTALFGILNTSLPAQDTTASKTGAKLDASADDALELQRFYSRDSRFSIALPKAWEHVLDEDPSALGAISSREGIDDKFRENLLVGSFPLNEKMSLLEYFSGNLEYLKNQIPSLEIKKTENIKVNGVDAVRVTYVTPIEGVNYMTLQIFTIKDSRGYIITTMGEEEKYEKYESVFSKMIDSFYFE